MGTMKTILLTLAAVACLAIWVHAQTPTGATPGAATGSAESSDGTFTVFHAPPIFTISAADKFFIDLRAATDAALDDEQIPTVGRPNGLATRKSGPLREGPASQGFERPVDSGDDVIGIDQPRIDSDFAAAVALYRKNVKSGKWKAFENGE